MWMFKHPFTQKEQSGLEGRTVDIGNLKLHVRNAIAEGGFSCVYLARDAINGSKHYALKHIVCNDEESLELVMKEISVMKSLKGHPNIVTLHAHSIFDMGRTKEAILVMEYCEKSLVNALESRGAGFFEEKQILTIFRDVCNATFAMHCQSPPIAHRDLKAENILLGSDGSWKLCDFGSTCTNHKRFEKPEEMGIEEDNIRKHTTPAYRAPEMWDLYRRELINEKVDIWALGCLLFRICYFKSAFDGESKLQILNGNYRIPELPKYSTSITDLIKDMLQSSPDARPDITQVWFRVNNLLPDGLQKSLPDRPPEIQQQSIDVHEGLSKPANKSNPVPRRSPPPPPSTAQPTHHASPISHNPRAGGGAVPIGAFWATQHAKDSVIGDEKTKPKFDDELISHSTSKYDKNRPDRTPVSHKIEEENQFPPPAQTSMHGKSVNRVGDGPSKDFEINLFPDDSGPRAERSRSSKPESTTAFQSEAFDAFVAEFDSNKLSPESNVRKPGKEDLLGAEVEKLKEQLAHANTEKAEIISKYEKLSAICRSQRQEIQELKQALATRTPLPNRDVYKSQTSSGGPPTVNTQREKIEGTVWELQQGLFDQNSVSPDAKSWQAFPDNDAKPQLASQSTNNAPKSVRTRTGHQNRQFSNANSAGNTWGFGTDNFQAVPAAGSQINITASDLNNPQHFGESKNLEGLSTSQPAGWAGF